MAGSLLTTATVMDIRWLSLLSDYSRWDPRTPQALNRIFNSVTRVERITLN